MKKIIVRTLISLAIILVVLLIIASTKPDNFRVERTLNVKASPESIAVLINDFHKWGSWSPYEKVDPSMKRTYSGADYGKGAIYEWDGNGKAGAGRMEIIETAPMKIAIKLDFLKPFEGHNTAEFILEPKSDSSTNVTWAIYGPNHFAGKFMGIFFNMDKMIGKDFETGLSNIRSVTAK